MTSKPIAAEPRSGLRWGLLGAQAALALALAAWWLPARAAWINGGVLFAAYALLLGWLLAAGGAFARASLRGWSWGALLLGPLVPLLFALGAEAAAAAQVNFMAVPYFALGSLLLAGLAADASAPPPRPAEPAWPFALALGLLALGLAWGAWELRDWSHVHLRWPDDITSIIMLLKPRLGSDATDIAGQPFDAASKIAELAAFALAGAGLALLLSLRRRLPALQLTLGLFLLALAFKLCAASLSSEGLGIVARKIVSVNTNYYKLSPLVDEQGPLAFLRDFNKNQAGMGFHANTHPPLPVLLYWALRHLCLESPFAVGLAVMALSAAAIFPLYGLGKALGGEEVGLAAAALFATSPLSAVLGNAGVDSLVLSLLAFTAWALQRAVASGSWRWSLGSGALMSLAGLFSFGANVALVFLGTWGLLLQWRRSPAFPAFAAAAVRTWAVFLVGWLAIQALLWLASLGGFSYLQSVRTAQYLHLSANQNRPFELWTWANVVLYTAYAGFGLLALWLMSLVRGLFRADSSDGVLLAGAAFVLTAIFSAFGRAEVQRQFLFGVLPLLPSAALALPRGTEGRLLALPLGLALALNLAGVLALQILILDYW